MRDQILDCIYAAVDEANLDRNGKPPIERSLETPIHGSASALDSLGLVNFVVAVEENVEGAFDVSLVLADDRALAQEPSPFESVGKLASYIEALLRQEHEQE